MMKVPVYINFGWMGVMASIFNFLYLPVADEKLGRNSAITIGIIHNFVVFMIYWALYRAFTNDAGHVPKDLIKKRPEVAEKALNKYYQDENEDKIINKSEISRRPIESSTEEATTHNVSADLESQNLITEVSKEQDHEVEKSRRSKRIRRSARRKVNKLFFTYCSKCDNLQPPRAQH